MCNEINSDIKWNLTKEIKNIKFYDSKKKKTKMECNARLRSLCECLDQVKRFSFEKKTK